MIELLINDNSAYSKIAIDGEKYLVFYKHDISPGEFSRKHSQGCGFEKYLKQLERKAKLAKLLSQR